MCAQDNSFSKERFTFSSEAVPEDHALLVIRFSGSEGLSELYQFTIRIATQKDSLPLEAMLSARATFTIRGADQDRDAVFSGWISSIVQTSRYNDWTFYELILHPGLWYYTRSVQNNFFIDKSVRELLEECLGKLGVFAPDYEFRLAEDYVPQDFSMQNNESLFDYMSWKMERDGLYYFFEEGSSGERLVITDSKLTHTVIEGTNPLRYSPGSGMESSHREEVITSFSLTCTPLPNRVILREYDWLNPNRPVVGTCTVSPAGLGEVYYYGEGFTTTAEGNRLAKLRAEALQCTARVFQGASANPRLRPGFCFSLEQHYDASFNREYLLTRVRHEGSQEAYLSQAIGVPISNADRLYYRNSFTCIPSDVQFRPARATQRNKVSGMITAFIDSAGDSPVAEINDAGCYKVVFPQDISDHASGRSSCWVRRMQPHVGAGHGFAFPLSPGVEVLITFLDGDPDRPVIAGAVSNAETGSMENASTAQGTSILTAAGGGLSFNTDTDKQGLVLNTGARSGIVMSSGSTDALLKFSDNEYSSVTTTASSSAGISNSVGAGFLQTIEASHGSFKFLDWKNLISITNDIAKWGKKYLPVYNDTKKASSPELSSDRKDIGVNTLSMLIALIKTAKSTDKLLKLGKKINSNTYSAVLTSGDTNSTLKLSTRMNEDDLKKYTKECLFTFLTTTALDVTSGVLYELCTDKDEKDGKEKDSKKDDENAEKKKHLSPRISAAMTALTARVPSLVAEIVTNYSLYKFALGTDPKGILLNANNGPLIGAAKGLHLTLADDGLVLSSFKDIQSLTSVSKQDALTMFYKTKFNDPTTEVVKGGDIASFSKNSTSATSHTLRLISAKEMSAHAPLVEITTKGNDDSRTMVAHIDKINTILATKRDPDIRQKAANYQAQCGDRQDTWGSLTLQLAPDKANPGSGTLKSYVTLQNKKGDVSLENENGNVTLQNENGTMTLNNTGPVQITATAAADGDALTISHTSQQKKVTFTCKDGVFSLLDSKNRGLKTEDPETIKLIHSASEHITMKSNLLTAQADKVLLTTPKGKSKIAIAGTGVDIHAGRAKVISMKSKLIQIF